MTSRRVETRGIWQFRAWRHKGLLRHLWDQLFLLDYWRHIWLTVRFIYLARIRRRLGVYSNVSEHVAKMTIPYNLTRLQDLAVVRSNALVKPLSVIESLDFDSRILCVGPRTEGEMFNLAAHGFRLTNLRGLDLLSYSPLIDLGDMHAMPYPDNCWDAVVCGWAIAYSDNKKQAASELVRVCRPGGVVAIGVEHSPETNEEVEAEAGYLPGSRERVASLEELLALFRGHVDTIYFSQEPVASRRHRVGSIVAIFSIRK